jgi:uncharacterized protein (TIGR03435 family)
MFLQSRIKMLYANTQRVIVSLLFVMAAAFGQGAGGPTFEVASIKKAEPLSVNAVMSGQMHIGMTIDAAIVNIRSMSMADLLRAAYKVKSFQISGPDWLGAERFDIVAKMPAGATRDQVPQMLQALLADRFKLTLHRTTSDLPAYALVVMKGGAKLKESPPDENAPDSPANGPAAPLAPTPTDGGAQVRAVASSDANGVVSTASPNGQTKMVPREGGMRLEMTKMNTTGMLEMLGRFVDRPIIDMTGLTGRYDFTLDIGIEDMLALARAVGMTVPMGNRDATRASDPGASSVFTGIQQYGLKLEPRKAPIDLLVIDHVEKTPTEN